MKKNSLVIPSFEELEERVLGLDQTSDIPTKCISCGFTENVPDFIYDECSTKKFHIKFKKRISTLTCQKCSKDTAVSLHFFKD